MTPSERALLLSTLLYHEHLGAGRCSCGWAEPGSHPEHVVQIFEDACLFAMVPPVVYDQDADLERPLREHVIERLERAGIDVSLIEGWDLDDG